jgi:signal transduction histidine kinase
MRQKITIDPINDSIRVLTLFTHLEQFLALHPMGQQEMQTHLLSGLQLISEALDVRDVVLYQTFEKPFETLLEQKAHWTLSGSLPDNQAYQMSSMERSGIKAWKPTLATGEIFSISTVDSDMDEQSFLARRHFSSAIAIPVFVQNSWWGFILAGNAEIRPTWDDASLMFSKIIAGVIGWFLQLESMQIAITRHNEELFELTHARDSFARENTELKHWKDHMFRSFMNDFVTPVNTLIGFSSTFRENELADADPEIRQICIDNIFQETQRLEKMLKKLTFVSHTQSVQSQREFHPVDLRFLCMELESLFRQRSNKQNIEYSFTIEDKPMIVRSEQFLFRQMLFNLLDHSLQDTPEGGWLNVQTDSNETDIIIRITHSARKLGIAASTDGFEKKSSSGQADNTRDYLSIAQRVVDLHHGKLAYDSDDTIGSVLTVILPRATP